MKTKQWTPKLVCTLVSFCLYCGEGYFPSFLPRWEETFWWTFSLEEDRTAGRTQPYFPYGTTGVYWCSCVQYDVPAKNLVCACTAVYAGCLFFSVVNLSPAIAFVDFDTTWRFKLFLLASKETDLWNTFLKLWSNVLRNCKHVFLNIARRLFYFNSR